MKTDESRMPMPTIIPTLSPRRESAATAPAGSRTPHYESTDMPNELRLLVFVPGVDASGLEITSRGHDLFLTARKARPVRVNWAALQLETAQQDYHLALRLGRGFDFSELRASLQEGLLSISVPKLTVTFSSERKVA